LTGHNFPVEHRTCDFKEHQIPARNEETNSTVLY
jgi:hypothetical protein